MKSGDTLPDLTLPNLSGEQRSLTSRRVGRVLALLHGDDCEACRRWRRKLAEIQPDLEAWDADAAAVLPADAPHPSEQEAGVPVLLREGRFGDLGEDEVAVLVADRHGQVWRVETADDADGLPEPASLERETQWIAIQCPECGVPDHPDQEHWTTSA